IKNLTLWPSCSKNGVAPRVMDLARTLSGTADPVKAIRSRLGPAARARVIRLDFHGLAPGLALMSAQAQKENAATCPSGRDQARRDKSSQARAGRSASLKASKTP